MDEVIGGPVALSCPKCGKKYHGNIRTGENLDKCPYCGYAPFDAGKLLRIIKREKWSE